ncbi:Tc toxin subunit A [Pseudomonas brassicacearum]|uniref:Virulence plasmid 28 protein n=1 Tax=Pseudomonas brassicacearum TaxID=930166 RepID=A0A423GM06_9PSED|nr:Tc toxin subunit A [Pseudomonas brassicacearum]ROM92499.1 virulence plasmid 28 protein [Pseudomonas brassicacearum]
MAASQNRPLQQIYYEVFSEKQRKDNGLLSQYIKRDGSVFPLVAKGVEGLVRDFGLSLSDAKNFLWRANALAIYVRRKFIEQELTGDKTELMRPMSGLLSLVTGPSFEKLFYPPFDTLCPPDALESVTSPVAYLIELLMWIRDRIEVRGDEGRMPLMERRTDLLKRLIDHTAVHQPVSSVDIIVLVLEAFIKAHGQAGSDIDDALRQARYPNGLPHCQDWKTIDFVARHHDLSVGAVARVVDRFFPYFLQLNAQGGDGERALLHASRLGPYQRELLTEDPVPDDDSEESKEQQERFYRLNFGTVGTEDQNINQVKFFCERTKLDALELEALISIRSFAPVRSANVPLKGGEELPPSGAQSGSGYLNAGSIPAVDIEIKGENREILHRLNFYSHTRFDRMNRKLRLDQWLGLSSEQVDCLLMAAINAEAHTQTPKPDCWISENTLQAIGLFQELRERYGCAAEDFAVFIDELSIFGRGEVLSQFDRIFNAQAHFPRPLQLDGHTFPVFPAPGEDGLTVNQLCSGLKIDLHTYRHLAQAIAHAHGREDTLICDLATLSSFYRMVKLPRMLGISPVEGILLLIILGGDSWLKALAGVPELKSNKHEGTPDALNIIHAMESCVRWCHEREMPVLWMLQQVSPIVAPAVSSNERQLFEQLRSLLSAALFSETALLMAGVPPLAGGASWLDLLTALVDSNGLVQVLSEAIELDYLTFARLRLDEAVSIGIGEGDKESRALIVEKMLGVLLQARAGQVSVIKECLAVYAGLKSELVLTVLTWAGGTVYQVLKSALEGARHDDGAASGRRRQQADEGDPLLALLADVRRRSAVVVKLDLSVELLEDYLAYGYKTWLSRDNKHEFTLSTLYYLSVLNQAVALGQQPPENLLDYLRQVNALPDPLSDDALALAQETAAIRLAIFFAWSVQDVRECARRVDPEMMLIKNLAQLDLLIRVRELSARSGMDALTIFLMGMLPAEIDKPAYARAAEHALLSLNASPAPLIPNEDEALEHMVKISCEVDRTVLVANMPEEKATFKVTVKNHAGKGLRGVNVYWQTLLGSIVQTATGTDGVATAEFIPGKVMGTATPRFRLDLYEEQTAQSVEIGAHKDSMFFPGPLMSREPDSVVKAGAEVELYAVMQDHYGNRGIGMPVKWSSEVKSDPGTTIPSLIIRPAEALTNQEGITRVFVSSPTGGTFEVGVTSLDSSETAFFDAITFAGPLSVGTDA